jgi:2-polyprenyl-3-methyl-5-hydroxy-6-metoxy-1,4-benzoquinol methylase
MFYEMNTYEQRVQEQIAQYAHVENIHDLPQVFHLWSRRFLRPGLKEVFGTETVEGFYASAVADIRTKEPKRIFSIGCGDGWLEIALAKLLLAGGDRSFEIVASDLSPILIGRFEENIASAGIRKYFNVSIADSNTTTIPGTFDVIIANHLLHHITGLEALFADVKRSLKPGGIFATNDMIGRNGHMRWPEVAAFVRAYWQFLRPEQRYNAQLQRPEPEFMDHDCSSQGFEGIRAQDILPLLLSTFHPRRFFVDGGLIDVFVDRSYGHGFRIDRADDCALIEHIGEVNELLLDGALIKPTIMFGHFVTESSDERYYRNRRAASCVRMTDVSAQT